MPTKSEVFDLSRFVARSQGTTQTSIPICIPTTRFRIHPDRERMVANVYLSRAGDEWWLVDASVAEDGRAHVPKLWRADLYEGVWANGRSFLLPVTFPVDGVHMDWYDSLTYGVTLARKQWVTVTSDRSQGCFIVTPEKQKRSEPEGWLDCEFHELVEFAFDDHIIYSKEDALAKLPRKSRRMVREEFDE